MAVKERTVTVRKVRNRMIIFYTVICLVMLSVILFYFFLQMTEKVNDKISGGVSSTCINIASAFNYYTDTAETDCTAVFLNDKVMAYDPITNYYADYEASNIKSAVEDELIDLSATSDYCDFALLFSDSSLVGKSSSGTKDIISDLGFEYFSEQISNGTDKWLYGINDDFSKIYYIRKITDHSVFLLSCYTDNLYNIVQIKSQSKNCDYDIFLIDGEDRIILSSNVENDSGQAAPSEKLSIFYTRENENVINGNYIGSIVETDCGWCVFAVTKTPVLLGETSAQIWTLVLLAVVVVIICIATGMFSCARFVISDIVNPDSEFIDHLTGILNEYGLDEKISEQMETSMVGSTFAFILTDIKDREQIKTTVSPRYWSNIRMRLIEKCEEHFSDRSYQIGRVSEDMIAIFADYSEFDIFGAHDKLKLSCNEFCRSFEDFTVGDDNALKLHVSIGVCIYPDHGEEYDELLSCAKTALEIAEQKEADSYVIYDPAKYGKEVNADEKKK